MRGFRASRVLGRRYWRLLRLLDCAASARPDRLRSAAPLCCSRRKQHTPNFSQFPEYFLFSGSASFFDQVWEGAAEEGSLAAARSLYCAWQLAANEKGNNADFLRTVILLFDLFIDKEEKR